MTNILPIVIQKRQVKEKIPGMAHLFKNVCYRFKDLKKEKVFFRMLRSKKNQLPSRFSRWWKKNIGRTLNRRRRHEVGNEAKLRRKAKILWLRSYKQIKMQQVPPPRTKFLDSITSPGCFPVDARANKCVRVCVCDECVCVCGCMCCLLRVC